MHFICAKTLSNPFAKWTKRNNYCRNVRTTHNHWEPIFFIWLVFTVHARMSSIRHWIHILYVLYLWFHIRPTEIEIYMKKKNKCNNNNIVPSDGLNFAQEKSEMVKLRIQIYLFLKCAIVFISLSTALNHTHITYKVMGERNETFLFCLL